MLADILVFRKGLLRELARAPSTFDQRDLEALLLLEPKTKSHGFTESESESERERETSGGAAGPTCGDAAGRGGEDGGSFRSPLAALISIAPMERNAGTYTGEPCSA